MWMCELYCVALQGGLGTENEMCLAFLMYYPMINLTNCDSLTQQESMAKGLNLKYRWVFHCVHVCCLAWSVCFCVHMTVYVNMSVFVCVSADMCAYNLLLSLTLFIVLLRRIQARCSIIRLYMLLHVFPSVESRNRGWGVTRFLFTFHNPTALRLCYILRLIY